MPFRLIIPTDEDRALVVESLRAAARQRTSVARAAAGKVLGEAKDPRSASVKIVRVLAEADTLERLAADLEAAEDADAGLSAAVLTAPRPLVGIGEPVPPAQRTGPDDGTGLSADAQAAAAAAGLKPYDPDAPEDPVTGATPEDDPDDVDDLDLDTPAPEEDTQP